VKDIANVRTAPSDQCVDMKGDPPMSIPANATMGDSKARGGPSVFPFWKIGHTAALRDSAGEKESITNRKTDELDTLPATTTTTIEEGSKAKFPVNAPQKPEEQATAKTGMLAFWKIGSSKSDGGNNKTQAATKEQLSVEEKSSTNEKTNELDATPATTTTATEEESKADSAVDAIQKPEEKATTRRGNSDADAPQKPEEKAKAKTGMLAFWMMGSSSAVVEKKGQPMTSDLTYSVDNSFHDQLGSDSSAQDGDNSKTLVSHGAVAVDKDADADASDEARNSMQSI
jgi:hypothetical protein